MVDLLSNNGRNTVIEAQTGDLLSDNGKNTVVGALPGGTGQNNGRNTVVGAPPEGTGRFVPSRPPPLRQPVEGKRLAAAEGAAGLFQLVQRLRTKLYGDALQILLHLRHLCGPDNHGRYGGSGYQPG